MDGGAPRVAPRRRRSRFRLRPSWATRRRIIVASAIAGCALIVGVGAFGWILASRIGNITHQNPLSVIKDAVTGGSGSSVGDAAANNKPITLALYGYGGSGHDGAYLTDSIMVVRIQPHSGQTAQVAEISIPRDWYVPIDLGNGKVVHGRINEAYAYAAEEVYPNRGAQYKGEFGAAALANDTLDHLLGIHIDHFVAMDFHAFQYAVDAVGGVDINVQHSFTDPAYPHGECDTGDCAVESVHFDAGPQHMDGARALIFARSRHSPDNGEGTDFARSKRQQLVLQAVRDKVISVGGITRLPDVLSALGGHVITDLSFGDSEQLYKLIKGVPTSAVAHVSIDDANFLYECGYPANCGAAYLFTHDLSYASLQQFIENVLPDPSALAEHTPITVLDGSGRGRGASARWASLLGMIGFTATDGGTTAPVTTTTVTAAAGVGAHTAAWLTDYFHAASGAISIASPAQTRTTASPSPTPAASGITLVIGSGEELAFFADEGAGSPDAAPPVVAHIPATAAPTAAPTPTATPTATATPEPTPSPTPAPLPITTPTPKPRPTPTPAASPSPTPKPGG